MCSFYLPLLLLLLLSQLQSLDGVQTSPPSQPFGIPAEFGASLLDSFANEEKLRASLVQSRHNVSINQLDAAFTLEGKPYARVQNVSFRLSTTPFVTSAGFRDLCFPHVLDNNGRTDTCVLPSNPEAFFKGIPDGSCIYMTAICYFTVMRLGYLELIPRRFSIVTHYSDRAVPDMDPKQKGYGVTQTLPTLQGLYDNGKLLAFHGMNLHYSHWSNPTVSRPNWLHCVPIGMRLRFYQPHESLVGFLDAIKRNVVNRPSTFWSDSSRPLLLVPIVAKRYARDRARALRELGANVKKKTLQMTQKTYDQQVDFFNAISTHRFTICPWGNGLDTHRLYEVLIMGGIPVVKKSSINSCIDGTDNNISVTVVDPVSGNVHVDSMTRGDIPVVIVQRWSDVTTQLLEAHWRAFQSLMVSPSSHDMLKDQSSDVPKRQGHWDYSRLIMRHWQQRIMGLDSKSRSVESNKIYYL